MRIILQRVDSASVYVYNPKYTASIERGLLLFVGIEDTDTKEDILWLAKKVVQMRIFPDSEDKMNNSVMDIKGELLVISQFTLHASTKKGNRPSFIRAARPEKAIPIYDDFIKTIQDMDLVVKAGIFGAHMKIDLVNNGPVTIAIDSKMRE